jgi:glucose/arabinose dehydrogenase
MLSLGLSATLGLAGCSQPPSTDPPTTQQTTEGAPTTGETPTGDLSIRLDTITEEPTSPLAFATAPDGRHYVVDRPGQIHLLTDGSIRTALDISDAVVTGGERGLLGVALHPEFGSNGRLYVRYSATTRSNTPSTYSHTFVLAEFRARSDGTVDAGSERTVLEIPQPQGNHNSGPIAFGPDGYLYVGVGDGRGANDQGRGHVEDWYDETPGGNGQDVTENLLGSLLRIDVDGLSGDTPYGIPADNPLVDTAGLDEHYAWGLRNPWGISFDGDDLYVADVGQGRFEEVNLVENGGNYGWNVKEGTHCFGTDSCPSTTPDGAQLRDPIIEYPHSGAAVSGIAVVGGHVYRGVAIPELAGRYVFGDLSARGRLFVASPTESGLWPTEVLTIAESDKDKLDSLLALGRDRDGELYALGPSGVYRLAPVE